MDKLKYEIRNFNIFVATAVALIFILVDFAVWCAVSSPIYTLRFISSSVPTLPLWLFGLFDFISYALKGFSLGAVLTVVCRLYDVYRYRGAFYFVIGVTMAFLHHAFFFSEAKFFTALLIALLQCLFLFIAVINFYKVSKWISVVAALGTVWSVYLLVLNVMTFFFV